MKFFHSCTSIGSADLYSWLVVDIRYVSDPSFEENIMISLICDIDLIVIHFQGLSFFWEALRMSSYVRWSVTVVFS